ncbi:glycosyltransferase [soil metagenome]
MDYASSVGSKIRPRRRSGGFRRETAARTLTDGQRVAGLIALLSLIALGMADPLALGRLAIAGVMAFMGLFMGLRFVLVVTGRGYRAEPVDDIHDEDLPLYTTLHPMYDEANMIPVVVAAMEAMNYPKHLLQCILVLEERDRPTVEAARAYPLPDYFTIVETPAVKPFGKPKACNYALGFATGEYVVIYDAEDRPEPDQLRKAVGAFRAAAHRGESLGCVQATLVFENETPVKGALGEVLRDRHGHDLRPTTWSSRLLGNEYTVHFRYVLPGLARLGLPVPLGGTSNHFPLSVLKELAFSPDEMPQIPGGENAIGAWDPWNVTEDAELGGAIAANGYKTGLLDSHTDEEAVLTPLAAVNQRSRWVKGYCQTSLVLLRHPLRNMRAMGPISYVAFLLQVGGTYLSLLLSPLCWGLTVTYFATDSDVIAQLFPSVVYYTGVALMIGGNLTLVSVSVAAAFGSRQFATVRYLLTLTPVWWILLSFATWVATFELVFPRWRPSWNKTAHGVRYLPRRRRAWHKVRAGINQLEGRERTPRPVGGPALATRAPITRARPSGLTPTAPAATGTRRITTPLREPCVSGGLAAAAAAAGAQRSSYSRSASSI